MGFHNCCIQALHHHEQCKPPDTVVWNKPPLDCKAVETCAKWCFWQCDEQNLTALCWYGVHSCSRLLVSPSLLQHTETAPNVVGKAFRLTEWVVVLCKYALKSLYWLILFIVHHFDHYLLCSRVWYKKLECWGPCGAHRLKSHCCSLVGFCRLTLKTLVEVKNEEE